MILVVGSTGYLGGMITRRLLEQGDAVRILVRPTSSYQPLVAAGAEPYIGDLKDSASLDAACVGVQTVVTTANTAQRAGEDTVEAVDIAGNRQLIDAARANGVEQLIYTSAYGVTADSPVPFLRAKALTEAYLRASALPYTIIAPDVFMDVWIPAIVGSAVQQHQPVHIVGEGRRKHTFVSAADVAAFAVAAIGHPAALFQKIAVGGPSAVSWRDIVRIVEATIKQPIPIQTHAVGDALPGFPELFTGLMTWLELHDSVIPMQETARTFGVTQTPIETFVPSLFAPMAAELDAVAR